MLKKSGRKRQFDLGQLHKIFEQQKSKLFSENGKVVPPSDKIWETIKRQHKIPSSSKSIYTDCLSWNTSNQKHSNPANQKHSRRPKQVIGTNEVHETSSDSNISY